MRVGLIGFGSAGRRHVQNLIDLGVMDIILLRAVGARNEGGLSECHSLDDLLATEPNVIVLSNPTFLHHNYLSLLLPLNMNLLVEKPLVSDSTDLRDIKKLLQDYKGFGMAAFNMRFHPVVIKTRELLEVGRLGKIYSARFHVGQYLPDWRPDQDYRKSYSSSREMGGGVVLDLIHEIDLAAWLVGLPAESISSRVSRSSDLEIDVEDIVEILYTDEAGAMVSIHLDYLTHGYRRHFELIGSEASLSADLYRGCIMLTDRGGHVEEMTYEQFERNDMYHDMMKSFIEGVKGVNRNKIPLSEVLDVNEMALALRDGVTFGG